MRRAPGQIAVAVIYSLLALNAWGQLGLALFGRQGDPPLLTALQVLIGFAAAAAAWGSWAGTRWAASAVVIHSLITAAMLASLETILRLEPDARSGLLIGAAAVLVWGFAFAWYLHRLTRRKP